MAPGESSLGFGVQLTIKVEGLRFRVQEPLSVRRPSLSKSVTRDDELPRHSVFFGDVVVGSQAGIQKPLESFDDSLMP